MAKTPTPCGPVGNGTDWIQIFTNMSAMPFGLHHAFGREMLKATAAAMQAQADWLRALAEAQTPEQMLAVTQAHMAQTMADAKTANTRLADAVREAAENATDRHATPV